MPTVIDALVITLGLDPSDFKRGSDEMTEEMKKQKKESEKLAKDMEAAGKKAASFFGSIKNELLALAGVTLTLGGIRSFVLSTADSLSKLGYAAQNLGMSSKELDGWQKSFAKFGVGAEQVRGSMAGLQNDLALLQNKGEISQGLITITGRLGINLQDKEGAYKSVQAIYMELADRFKNMDPATRQMYGRDVGLSPEMVNMLSRGSGAVKQDVSRYTAISNATDEATKKAQLYEQKLSDLASKFDATKQKILIGMMPALEQLNRLLDKFGDWINKNSDKIAAFFNEAAIGIGDAAKAVGDWHGELSALAIFMGAVWLGSMLGPIGKVIAMIVLATSKVKSLQEEAGKVGKTKGEYLLDKVNENQEKNGVGFWEFVDKAKNYLGFGDEGEEPAEPVQHAQSANRSKTRGARNNNPGNLEFRGQRGAVPEQGPGRFAAFKTMGEGVAALYRQLIRYFQRGKDTIAEIVNTYAPSSDGNNVQAYISHLSKATGKGANEKLNPNDIETMRSLMRGIVDHESGKDAVSNADLIKGLQLGAGASFSSMPSVGRGSSTSEVHIGALNIYTQATDAKGIATSMHKELGQNPLIGTINGAVS